MAISDLFSDEKVNTGRQVELDIAKAFAIIFFGNVLGRPYAAVIFMFCMVLG